MQTHRPLLVTVEVRNPGKVITREILISSVNPFVQDSFDGDIVREVVKKGNDIL